jgi:DnaJ-class molecular chaperone
VKYHPDKNKGDKASEYKFKEISGAYNVVGDPEKRKQYDQLGANWIQYKQAGGDPSGFDWRGIAGNMGEPDSRAMDSKAILMIFLAVPAGLQVQGPEEGSLIGTHLSAVLKHAFFPMVLIPAVLYHLCSAAFLPGYS